MVFLINATNLKVGGGIQVADSICCSLERFARHRFVVVLSSRMDATAKKLEGCRNVEVYRYDVRNNARTLLFGRDRFLDGLVEEKNVDGVLTIFGPSRWNPRCPHLCGFARPHLVIPESPFFRQLPFIKKIRSNIMNTILTQSFKNSTHFLWTENPYISKRLEALISRSKVFTVTNYYNQVYDHPEQWRRRLLPAFEGVTMLTVTAAYPHKNLPICLDVAKVLKKDFSDFRFRFVLTIDRELFPPLPAELEEHFVFTGRVDISECPSLYEQSDIMFQPSLLECFTATYPEAMKMQRPIVTTDLEFARGLCGDAALYYSPLSAEEAAAAIHRVATDAALRTTLVAAGRKRLARFDSYEERATKLFCILEGLA